MANIQTLYSSARYNGSSSNIKAYEEAVAKLNPTDFISETKYITQSSLGVKYLKEFASKYGLAIPFAKRCISLLEETVDECTEKKINKSEFEEALNWLTSFRDEYKDLFSMYEWYSDEDESEYIKEYYGFGNGKQNRFFVNRMISFGEQAVPDLFITSIQKKSLDKFLEYLYANKDEYDNMFYEWVSRGIKDNSEPMHFFRENAPSNIVAKFHRRKQTAFREAVIMHTEEAIKITPEERIAVDTMIRFNEFALSGLKNFDEAKKLSKEIYTLYEDSIIEPSEEVNSTQEDLVPVYCVLHSYFTDKEWKQEAEKSNNPELFHDTFGGLIRGFSGGDNYGHVLISFDPEFKEAFEVMNSGFQKANPDDPRWMGTKNIYVSVMFIPPSDFEKMKSKCYDLLNSGNVEYAWSNLAKAFVSTPSKMDNRFICSSFVGYILGISDTKNLQRDYSRMRPEDLTLLPRAFHVIDVKNIEEYRDHLAEVESKVKSIYARHKEELFEYNNELPKLILAERKDKLTNFDKFFGFICNRIGNANGYDPDGSMAARENNINNPNIETTECAEFVYPFDEEALAFSIYTEDSEDDLPNTVGIKINDYEPLYKIISGFMQPLDKLITRFNKNPGKIHVALDDEISKFKNDINISPKNHEIDIRSIGKIKRRISKFEANIEDCISRFSKMKDKMAYGGNLWRGIINRPKVLTKNINSEEYDNINSGIRQINRAMDWIEKALLEVSKLAANDMGIVKYIDKVYRKNNIYEAVQFQEADAYDKLPSVDAGAHFIRSIINPGLVDKHPAHATPTRRSTVPTYLRNAHTVARWGEEPEGDSVPTDPLDRDLKTKSDEPNKDDLENFTRPSADNSIPETSKEEPKNEPTPTSNQTSNPTDTKPNPSYSSTGNSNNISNYYYYNYQNSLNKNQGSFNKSTDNSVDNRKNTNNDIKMNTNINSIKNGNTNADSSAKDFHHLESSLPWELSPFRESNDSDDEESDRGNKDNSSFDGKYKPVYVILKSYFTEKERKGQIDKNHGDGSKAFKDPFPIIHTLTGGDNYGHAVISFDLDFKKSFEVFPVGLIRTEFDDSWHGTKNLYIDVVYVTNKQYNKMMNKCEYLIHHPKETGYDYSGLLKAFFAKPTKHPGRHLCSAFVAFLLEESNSKNIHRDYSRMRPEDLTLLPRSFHLVDTQNIDTYMEELPSIRKKVREIYDKHKKEINEYNEELPKFMLKSQNDNLSKFDKGVDKIAEKLLKVDDMRKEKGMVVEESNQYLTENIGDADNDKPRSDHPIKDTIMDIDRATLPVQQAAKKGVQNVQNVGRALKKPLDRTNLWLGKVLSTWRDQDETALKEKIADPHARKNLFYATKTAIKYGSLWYAGLLMNPIILGAIAYNKVRNKGKELRLRNEIIGELNTELEIIDEKIKDADSKGDKKAKYQLMRFKGEVKKKLLRVSGGKGMAKIL